jgi:hypothetical protein
LRFAIDLLLNFLESLAGNGFGHVLRIQSEQPNLILPLAQVINDSQASPFTTAFIAPAHLPNAAGFANHIPGSRILVQITLQSRQLVVRQIFIGEAGKQAGFYEYEHPYYTAVTYYVNAVSPGRWLAT